MSVSPDGLIQKTHEQSSSSFICFCPSTRGREAFKRVVLISFRAGRIRVSAGKVRAARGVLQGSSKRAAVSGGLNA